jgi:hypothetical protein
MQFQLSHFHMRQRRICRPDYARTFRAWYDRHRHAWWLPALTPDETRLIAAWEQRRCNRTLPNRAILDDPGHCRRLLAILYVHYLTQVILRGGHIAIIAHDVRLTRSLCLTVGMNLRHVHICSLRNPRNLMGHNCDTALILDADRAPASSAPHISHDNRFYQALSTLLPMMDFTPGCFLIIHGDTTRRNQGRRPAFLRFILQLRQRPASDNPYLILTQTDATTHPAVDNTLIITHPAVGMSRVTSADNTLIITYNAVGTSCMTSATTPLKINKLPNLPDHLHHTPLHPPRAWPV